MQRERAIERKRGATLHRQTPAHTGIGRIANSRHRAQPVHATAQNDDEQARIAQLVKVYEAMKARNAAAIFDPMALDLLLPIVRQMRETKVAAIVAEMDPAKARALTAELARSRAPAAP